MASPVYLTGWVHSIVYQNGNFHILRVAIDSEFESELSSHGASRFRPVSVRGDIHGMRVERNSWLGFEAVWENHPQHGPQLKITSAPVIRGEWDSAVCLKMLSSRDLPPRVLETLRKVGPELPTVLLTVQNLVACGLSEEEATSLRDTWLHTKANYQAVDTLSKLGLPQSKIRQVWAHFGETAREVLSTNPWALTVIDGLTFEDADSVAKKLGISPDSKNPLRLKGAIQYVVRSGRGMGHLYSTISDLVLGVKGIDENFVDRDIAYALHDLSKTKDLVLEKSFGALRAVYDPWFYQVESVSAELLLKRLETAKIPEDVKESLSKSLMPQGVYTSYEDACEQALRSRESVGGMTLSPLQRQAVLNALTYPVSVITGLPGTGKTTCLRLAHSLLSDAGFDILCMAPTGIAAKRISEVTGSLAYTIHKAFKSEVLASEDREFTYIGVVGESSGSGSSDGRGETWGFNQEYPHPAGVIVVDESSMLDQHLLYRILSGTKPTSRLVFVGDAAQLPSVGPGSVLQDLIGSGVCPVVSLTEIFRQSSQSAIVSAAHRIHRGLLPDMSQKDFSLEVIAEEEDVANRVCEIAKEMYSKKQKFQVLSPRHSGPVGVTELNTRLREVLNPSGSGQPEIRLGGETLRVGDRVMIVRNDYQLSVFNGDLGKVVSIDKVSQTIEVKIHGDPPMKVQIPLKKAPKMLRLAYAVTIHKSQGLEYDNVILPWVSSFKSQLSRRILYTAITRARKSVSLLGHNSAVESAVKNDRESDRNTLFCGRLVASRK